MTKTADQIHADAVIHVARATLAEYETRKDMIGTPDWDLAMAARLSVDVKHLLAVIDRMAGK